jgi:hypothetical protein
MGKLIRQEQVDITVFGISTYTAGENLSAYTVCVQADDKVYAADSSDITHAQKVVGLATTSAITDADISVQSIGIITNIGWSWTPGDKIYYTDAGTVSTTLPIAGFVQQIGVASSATTITIDLGLCIAL